jgi:hypothetical protein
MANSKSISSEPIYGRIWRRTKVFPGYLARGATIAPSVSGPAAAAYISAGIGGFAMMVAHHLSDTSKEREAFLKILGNWIPGANSADKLWGNIGSYAGKETVLLIAWLLSWLILHQFWKHKQIKANQIFFWFFALFIAATAMSWHPLFPYLPLI